VRCFVTIVMLLVGACDQVFDLSGRQPIDAPGPPADAVDAPRDASPTFGAVTAVTLTCPLNRTSGDVTLDRSETLFIYICTNASATDSDIYEAPVIDPTLGGAPTVVLMTAGIEGSPELSPDGLDLYFLTFSVPGIGVIERLVRTTLGSPFVATPPGGGLNTVADERPGSPNDTTTRMVISRGDKLVELRNEGTWMVVPTTSAIAVPGLSVYVNPHLSADGLTLVFAAGAGTNPKDLYVARRTLITDAWDAVAPITELNTAQNETDPWLSADGLRIYFARSNVVLVARK
jgi:Tol biopolymer transport system component